MSQSVVAKAGQHLIRLWVRPCVGPVLRRLVCSEERGDLGQAGSQSEVPGAWGWQPGEIDGRGVGTPSGQGPSARCWDRSLLASLALEFQDTFRISRGPTCRRDPVEPLKALVDTGVEPKHMRQGRSFSFVVSPLRGSVGLPDPMPRAHELSLDLRQSDRLLGRERRPGVAQNDRLVRVRSHLDSCQESRDREPGESKPGRGIDSAKGLQPNAPAVVAAKRRSLLTPKVVAAKRRSLLTPKMVAAKRRSFLTPQRRAGPSEAPAVRVQERRAAAAASADAPQGVMAIGTAKSHAER